MNTTTATTTARIPSDGFFDLRFGGKVPTDLHGVRIANTMYAVIKGLDGRPELCDVQHVDGQDGSAYYVENSVTGDVYCVLDVHAGIDGRKFKIGSTYWTLNTSTLTFNDC